MKKYENKQVEGKVSKENRDMTRNLCFHDWLIVRELKVLDDMYDEMLRLVNYRVLNLCETKDSDERQKNYDRILEERETLRTIYIQRRNELKAGFTDRQERQDREVSEKGWRKSRIERLSDVARSGYVLSDKEAKAILNKRFGCIDESEEFKDDPIAEAVLDERNISKKPDVKFVFNEHDDLKGLRRLTNPIDEVGPATALTPEYLDSVIREYNKEDE